MDSVFDTYLKNYAQTRVNEVSEFPKVNFVSVDFVIDAFEKGKNIGVEDFKKNLQEKSIRRINEQVDFTIQVVNQLVNVLKEKNYTLNRMFLAINSDNSKILISLPDKEHYSEDFMNMFYPLASDIEESYSRKGFNFDISAIDESDNINIDLLKCDGYNFCYDMKNNKKLF